MTLSMESGVIVNICLAAETLSQSCSDESLAFLILPLFPPFPRVPRLSPLREEEIEDNLDVEEDLRLGNEGSFSTKEFVVDDLDVEELTDIGTTMSPCLISWSIGKLTRIGGAVVELAP